MADVTREAGGLMSRSRVPDGTVGRVEWRDDPVGDLVRDYRDDPYGMVAGYVGPAREWMRDEYAEAAWDEMDEEYGR